MGTTEQRVRRAAIELFAERGFHGTGIRDLALRAGLSSATLYHYMGTKEDLLVSIMRSSLTRLITAGERLVTPSPVECVAGLVQMHVMTHAMRQQETRVVDDEMRSLTSSRRDEVVSLRDRYEQLWQDAIDAGCASGVFTVTAPRVARLALLEMCSGIARWYTPDGPLPLPELALRYTEMGLGLLGCTSQPQSHVTEIRTLIDTVWE